MSKSDLTKIYEMVSGVAPSWYAFGLHLRLSFDILEDIHKESKTLDHSLRRMLTEWVTTAPSPTYKELAKALRKIGHSDLASEVEKMFDKSFSGPGQLT